MSSEKPRVLIVDDSAFMRQMAAQIIEGSGEFVVVGTARNGLDGLKQIGELQPDIVTLDVDMPEMDGLSALRVIMAERPRPVVMLSAGTTSAGHEATIRALELGAVDFVTKPSGSISLDLELITDRLLGALRLAAAANLAGVRGPSRKSIELAPPRAPAFTAATQVVVIASSTGGPRALAAILPHLPATLPAAVLIVQHMPRDFTRSLALRLDRVCALPVAEAEHGERVVSGRVYVAPGGVHLSVRGGATGPSIALDDNAPIWGVRPAADVLFRSAAELFGASTVAVVLTGMGRDGADGTRAVRGVGGLALLQDRESATIFGMPQAALRHAGADRVMALSEIGAGISELVGELRHAS